MLDSNSSGVHSTSLSMAAACCSVSRASGQRLILRSVAPTSMMHLAWRSTS